MKTIKIIGMLLGIIALVLAWLFYGWQLTLIIFIALTGNNLNQIN